MLVVRAAGLGQPTSAATGEEYIKFRAKFDSLIEELLGSPKRGPG